MQIYLSDTPVTSKLVKVTETEMQVQSAIGIMKSCHDESHSLTNTVHYKNLTTFQESKTKLEHYLDGRKCPQIHDWLLQTTTNQFIQTTAATENMLPTPTNLCNFISLTHPQIPRTCTQTESQVHNGHKH